jgi:crotonobetainyl-CoA:carnitine CoA-transferase CaiB-like acyl-CoA transferase
MSFDESEKHSRESRLPLEGIRVVDMTVVWSGTFAAMLLADMGAEVIRVESTKFAPYGTRGVAVRPTPALLQTRGLMTTGYPNREGGERPYNRTALFNVHARNKLSMTVDYMRPEGLQILKRLIAKSDIFIENNAYGVVKRLGLGYEEVSEVKPDIIMISMPGFGNSGPYRDRVALGRHLECIAGHTMLRGYRDADPTWTTEVYHCDASAGGIAAFAALTALHYRQRTGKGQFVDVAQVETIVPQLGEFVMDYVMNSRLQEPLGNRDPWAAPCGLYPCRGEDRWVAITVFTDEEWQGLVRAMGSPSWSEDRRFSSTTDRWRHQDDLDAHIAEWTQERDDYEVMRLLQAEKVAAGALMDEKDCYSDPHVRERGFFEQVDHAECGTHLYPGVLWKMSGTPLHIRKPPCRLGGDNEYVYKTLLGVSDQEYSELEREGHIGTEYDPGITVYGRPRA